MAGDVGSAISVSFLSLYSSAYPSIGESHGTSVVAGIVSTLATEISATVHLLDMVEAGLEDERVVLEFVERTKPNLLCIALNYGTYSVLCQLLPRLRTLLPPSTQLIIGGPLATYLADLILEDLAPDAVIVIGEGEYAIEALARRYAKPLLELRDVPSIAFRDPHTREVIRTSRQLIDVSRIPAPYSTHLPRIAANGGQVFIEASRGCAWAACTFCLRGLTDVSGRRHEYRRFPAEAVCSRMTALRDMGIEQVTFADEDFIGSQMSSARDLAELLLARSGEIPAFDASFTVESIYSRHDSIRIDAQREELVSTLAKAGLRKAFLGIESCSDTQLRRYAKGHTAEEAAHAVARCQRHGIQVEIGVILFDPLCTLSEIEESLQFMLFHGLERLASGISSHLRLQAGSAYLHVLDSQEKRLGLRLYDRAIDPDTLSHEYEFVHRDVGRLFRRVGAWNRALHSLYYPSKSMSRFSDHGALGEATQSVRSLVGDFRTGMGRAILNQIISRTDSFAELDAAMASAARDLAEGLTRILPKGPEAHPLILATLTTAKNVESLVHVAMKGQETDGR